MRTVILKLYGPGKEKRRILDEAISNYNAAYRFLLDRARVDIAGIRRTCMLPGGLYKASTVMKWVGPELGRELNRFNVQPFKDSLKFEIGMVLAGYLNLEGAGNRTRFPEQGISADRPVYFCRYDIKRSYCLLYDRAKDRYYVKLYLMNKSCARRADTKSSSKGRLEYIYPGAGVFDDTGSKLTYIISPVSFGKYQEAFLKRTLADPGILKTARLMKRGKDYYLAVSMETAEKKRLTAESFMGVSRGLKNGLNYTVVDLAGKVRRTGTVRGISYINGKGNVRLDDNGKRTVRPDEIHAAANNIRDIALENGSRVILQNLKEVGDNIIRLEEEGNENRPVYGCRSYMRLASILEYKLTEAGLPPPVKTSCSDIFYRCHECGFCSRQNRFNREILICTKCGATMRIDDLGSLNLARRLIRYGGSKIRVKVVKTTEGTIFTNSLMELDYFIPYTEDPMAELKQKIKSILEGMRESVRSPDIKRNVRKLSLLRKFESAPDCMELIEFI